MTRRFRDIWIVPVAVMAAWCAGANVGARADELGSELRIETFRTHSRLSIHVDDGVISELKNGSQGFELLLKGIGLTDLGAPLGEEARWAERFKKIQDPRLQSIEFAEVPGGLRVEGRWRYPQGAQALANAEMEAFEYRERAQAQLMLDFWVKEGLTVSEVKTRHEAQRKLASVKKRVDDEKARVALRLASEKARAEAADPKLFCKTPLGDRSDVFLRFNPVHEPFSFAHWFSDVAPDADYSYYSPKDTQVDAQYVHLALKLYREGNFALANRTIDFFEKECQGSAYRSEMRFLRANALLKLGLQEEATQLLREIARDPKSRDTALHAGMFLAAKQMDARNYLGALELFSWLADHQMDARLAWVFHMGAAECARQLRQTDRAVEEYQWVADHAPDMGSRSEGALRLGDLYLDRFQYDQALAAYAQAARHFPEQAKDFAPLRINRAESLYQLGQYKQAAEAFVGFLDRFGSHPAGWRATYRLGELAARGEGGLGSPKAPATRESPEAIRWYLDTVNRFPYSPGATLARLQLLPCGDHAGLTGDAADRFYAGDAEKFDGSGEVSLEGYKDFRALSRVRSLMTMGRQEDAVAQAIAELRRVPKAEARRWLSHLLLFNFRKSILELLDQGEKLEALTFFEQHEGTVPLGDPEVAGDVDPDYLLKLSRAASDLSLGKLAQTISGRYDKAAKSQKSDEELQRSLASVEAKLSQSERAFTQAKALWIGDRMKSADEVRAKLGLVAPESRFSFEREIILGLLDENKGDAKGALRHAVQAQLLGPAAGDSRISAWVASLEARAGSQDAALRAYRELERPGVGPGAGPGAVKADSVRQRSAMSTAELLGVPAVPARETIVLAVSGILEKQGRWGEAAAEYSRAVDQGLGGAEARYGYARALLNAGGADNRSKALGELEKLVAEQEPAAAPSAKPRDAASPGASANTKFWRKLASETLADEKAKNSAKEGMKP